jgi:hypothetical protein
MVNIVDMFSIPFRLAIMEPAGGAADAEWTGRNGRPVIVGPCCSRETRWKIIQRSEAPSSYHKEREEVTRCESRSSLGSNQTPKPTSQ